jgi:hypothetical protein
MVGGEKELKIRNPEDQAGRVSPQKGAHDERIQAKVEVAE